MSDAKSSLDQLLSNLKQERDELKLKMHLASMDAKDEYNRLVDKCDQLSKEYEPVSKAVEDTTENVFSALGMVAEELKIGFDRVRNAINESPK